MHGTHLETVIQRRRFRRPDRYAIDEAQHRVNAQQRYLENLKKDRARSAAELERRRRRLNEAEQAVARIPDVERTIKQRSDWILSHPAELTWEAELAARLGEATSADVPVPDREQAVADYDLRAAWPEGPRRKVCPTDTAMGVRRSGETGARAGV